MPLDPKVAHGSLAAELQFPCSRVLNNMNEMKFRIDLKIFHFIPGK